MNDLKNLNKEKKKIEPTNITDNVSNNFNDTSEVDSENEGNGFDSQVSRNRSSTKNSQNIVKKKV